MKKESIVQFVCFVTNLELDEFAPKWDHYSKRSKNSETEPVLYQKEALAKNKFRYISQQECPDFDFSYVDKNDRRSEHFPEQSVRIIQAGGYLPQKQKGRHAQKDGDIKVMALISHDENDIDFYGRLPSYHNLNIYQAYYESCLYGYVLEFFVPETDADELLRQLKQRHGVEAGIYKECLVPHV